jgi:hypothetical protein
MPLCVYIYVCVCVCVYLNQKYKMRNVATQKEQYFVRPLCVYYPDMRMELATRTSHYRPWKLYK